MDQANWDVEIVADMDLDRLYLGLDVIKTEPSIDDVSVEVTCSMMMPAGESSGLDRRLAEQDLLGVESSLPDNTRVESPFCIS